MGLVTFAWATTQKYFREIVAQDVRKQLQLENMNQYDEETLPAPVIENGLEHEFMLEGGDVWEKADSRETYAEYFREIHR
jgi:hypothetical protein